MLQNTSAILIDNIFSSSINIGLSGIILSDISDHNIIFAIEDISLEKLEEQI